MSFFIESGFSEDLQPVRQLEDSQAVVQTETKKSERVARAVVLAVVMAAMGYIGLLYAANKIGKNQSHTEKFVDTKTNSVAGVRLGQEQLGQQQMKDGTLVDTKATGKQKLLKKTYVPHVQEFQRKR